MGRREDFGRWDGMGEFEFPIYCCILYSAREFVHGICGCDVQKQALTVETVGRDFQEEIGTRCCEEGAECGFK